MANRSFTPPNILVFLTDDHGQWASGAYGNRELHTPAMDWLAATGIRFENGYTTTPVCSPARATFWTGQLPSAHGLHDYLYEASPEPTTHPGIRDQETLGEALQSGGYRVGLTGKWHCGHPNHPRQAFETWFTSARGTNAAFREQLFYEKKEMVEWYGHQSPRVTDRAIQFLREQKDSEPFFLFVGYTDTHTPHQGAPEFLAAKTRQNQFVDIPKEEYEGQNGEARRPMPPPGEERHEHLAQYYAAVETIDQQMGRILMELENRGMMKNTLIVYTSDHGHMNGQHGLHCKGNATLPQNFLEESIRVPMILRWQDQWKGGQVRKEFFDHCDLHATLRKAAGQFDAARERAEKRPGQPLADRELQGTLPNGWKQEQICEYGNARMIRKSRFKLIRRYPGVNGRFPDELYDVQEDPRETTNRIEDPDLQSVVDQLSDRLEEHFAEFEVASRSGKEIGRTPWCNPHQAWGDQSQPPAGLGE